MIYATWSQGFRRGGVNALPTSEPELGYTTPPELTKLQPDTADNYEIGIKGTLHDRVRYSAAIFDIQWHNIQEGVQETPLVLPAALNIGDAYSRGLESELYILATTHVTAQLAYTYNQTKLTSLKSPVRRSQCLGAPAGHRQSPFRHAEEQPCTHFGVRPYEVVGGELSFAATAHYQSSVVPALSPPRCLRFRDSRCSTRACAWNCRIGTRWPM